MICIDTHRFKSPIIFIFPNSCVFNMQSHKFTKNAIKSPWHKLHYSKIISHTWYTSFLFNESAVQRASNMMPLIKGVLSSMSTNRIAMAWKAPRSLSNASHSMIYRFSHSKVWSLIYPATTQKYKIMQTKQPRPEDRLLGIFFSWCKTDTNRHVNLWTSKHCQVCI